MEVPEFEPQFLQKLSLGRVFETADRLFYYCLSFILKNEIVLYSYDVLILFLILSHLAFVFFLS
jgi:hypothetical protein